MGMLVAFSRSTADMLSCSWNGRMMQASTGDTEKLSVAVPTTSSSSTMPSAGANASLRGALARWNACACASAAVRAQSAQTLHLSAWSPDSDVLRGTHPSALAACGRALWWSQIRLHRMTSALLGMIYLAYHTAVANTTAFQRTREAGRCRSLCYCAHGTVLVAPHLAHECAG